MTRDDTASAITAKRPKETVQVVSSALVEPDATATKALSVPDHGQLLARRHDRYTDG